MSMLAPTMSVRKLPPSPTSWSAFATACARKRPPPPTSTVASSLSSDAAMVRAPLAGAAVAGPLGT